MRGCAQLSGSDKFNEGAAPCRAALRCAAELRIHSEVRMFCVILLRSVAPPRGSRTELRRGVGQESRIEHLSWCVRFLLQRLRVTHYDCLHSSSVRPPSFQRHRKERVGLVGLDRHLLLVHSRGTCMHRQLIHRIIDRAMLIHAKHRRWM